MEGHTMESYCPLVPSKQRTMVRGGREESADTPLNLASDMVPYGIKDHNAVASLL